MTLIDYPDTFDAIQIVTRAGNQIWDEVLAAECPSFDPTRHVIPPAHATTVFSSPGYKLLARIELRILQSLQNIESEVSHG